MKPPRYYSRFSTTLSTNGGNLPHWTQACATFVTFRLADSLPSHVLASYESERRQWLDEHPQPWDDKTEGEYRILFPDRLEQWLDAGHGECLLRDQRLRTIVEESLRYFDGVKYSLYAYVVMPNHVHVLYMPEEGFDGREIVAGWKRYSATKINRCYGRTGSLWQKESYDHLVRDVREFNSIMSYIRQNSPTLAYDAYAHM